MLGRIVGHTEAPLDLWSQHREISHIPEIEKQNNITVLFEQY